MSSTVEGNMKTIQKLVNSSIVKKAYEYARILHGDQKRKDGTLYISHPVEVALILAKQGFDEDVVSAALLHDVIEDCDCTVKQLTDRFNSNIANLVDAVSAINNNEYKYNDDEIFEDVDFVKASLEEQTFKKLISIGKKHPLAFSIKFADRLHNLRTISVFERSKQLEKVRETEKWILPIAKNLGSEYFYTEISNECFKIVNDSENCGFFRQYDNYHQANKNNFEKLMIRIKEAFASSAFAEIKSFDKFENLVFEDLSKLIKVNDISKISQGQILKVSNYNIYFLHNYSSNKKAVSEFVNIVQGKLSDIVKINDANISSLTKKIYFEIEDNYRNKYSANVLSKKEFTEQMLGTLDGQIDNYFDEENTHFIPTEYIKIKTRSGEIKCIPKDSTALDFAFKLHKDIGFGFKYAIINNSKTRMPPYTKLNDGDKVEIIVDRDKNDEIRSKVSFKWMAYVNNEASKRTLIKYFEKKYSSDNKD